MKLNWFSPLLPASTDIAHFTGRILPAISRLAEITLWTEQREWEPSLRQYAEIRSFSSAEEPWRQLNSSDISIYNIGNNPLFHAAIWQIAIKHPGIVILHDLKLHHMFAGFFKAQKRDFNGYLAEMERYYGDEGRREGLSWYQMEGRNIDEMAERYPLTQLALRNALGAVVHTSEAYKNLRENGDWPVAYLPLPFPSQSVPPVKEAAAGLRPTRPPYNIIVFGYLGKNRGLRPMLEALSVYSETDQFHLDVFGPVLENENELRGLIRTLGMNKIVKLHGYVAEPELDAALSKANLAINLRYPTMGEASGSQLRIWSHALPSIVSQIGWYATLPKDIVSCVQPGGEVNEIRNHLDAFLSDPAVYVEMGRRGRELLARDHSPTLYASGLLEFATSVVKLRSRAAFNKLASRAGCIIGEWNGSPPRSVIDRVAEEIKSMESGTPD